MPYAMAAASLRAAIPEVVTAYRTTLLRENSPLGINPGVWSQCRRQALAILNECVDALGLPTSSTTRSAIPDEYTRLLGSHRALQAIPASESVRAVEILWSSLEPAIELAAKEAPLTHRPGVWRRINAAFRLAAGGRLHTGMLSYEETRGHLRDRQLRVLEAASDASLTNRELEVLEAVAFAMTNRQIARTLNISELTVKRHLSNAYLKLGASSRMDALHRLFGSRI
ncbi:MULTISPECIES: helix-turn-helix transcriptional regulator [Nocardiaceae]|uniref:Putative LuxR-type two-component transcription regulator n=3 Tax=Mycobacteriales TaxID=85007 RepID=G8JYX4_RHOFA|nr:MULTISPECIES: LuxR C-terminal-related transcriptional regulator [Rhodococcus]AET25245.1 putative LuxR-type two-component transcription regulator [Rhodococcus fascians D188]AMY56271.1 HTH-type transcriptional regulator MalT [Rhodococcus fascians D188]